MGPAPLSAAADVSRRPSARCNSVYAIIIMGLCLLIKTHLNCRSRSTWQQIVCQISEQADTKTVVVKSSPGDLPLPWSEKDPYKLPASIDRVQRLLYSYGEARWCCLTCSLGAQGQATATHFRVLLVVGLQCCAWG